MEEVMTKFTQKSFTVATPSTQSYRDGWEKTFGEKTKETCMVCDKPFTKDEWEDRHDWPDDGRLSVHASCCVSC